MITSEEHAQEALRLLNEAYTYVVLTDISDTTRSKIEDSIVYAEQLLKDYLET